MGGGVGPRRSGLIRCGACGCDIGRLEPGHASTELPVFVPEFPVRLGEPLEALGHPARPQECGGGKKERDGRGEPMKGQQTSYLIERLATVSTA